MEDNDEVVTDEPFEEIDECSVKIEQQIDQDTEENTEKYLDFNLEVNDFLETEDSKPIVVKLNKQPLDTKLQSQVFMLHSYNSITAERSLPKYRPIRPKPCATDDKSSNSRNSRNSRNKLVEIPAPLNYVSVLNRPIPKRSNRVMVNDNAGSTQHDKNEIHGIHDKNGTHGIYDKNGIHGTHDKNRFLKKNKSRATIELFFDSMAQSVSKLPAEVQAEIKMEICKLVTRAEIKHYGSRPK